MDLRISVSGYRRQKELLRALGIPVKVAGTVGRLVIKLVAR
jgi:hypothetical protein